MSSPQISFIICTYNRAAYLKDAMISLLKNEVNPSDFELLIIDNNSSDNTFDTVQKVQKNHPNHNIKYVKESKQGLSYARNRGIDEANTSILIFVDDDIIAPGNYIENWIYFFKKHPDAVAAGGKINIQFDAPRPAWMSKFLLPLLAAHDLGNNLKNYKWGNHPVGANMAFRKHAFEQYGEFETNLGRKGSELTSNEEKELYSRIFEHSKKKTYYVPSAYLFHRVGAERLAVEYIKKQAHGLGKSKAINLERSSIFSKSKEYCRELIKLFASLLLFIPYTLTLQIEKATMLLKFRKWIWDGYQSYHKTKSA